MKNQRGFTLPELVIVIGIVTILFGFISINLIHLQRRSYLTTTADTLVSDLYSQQNKAMVGDTEGRTSTSKYGVYFEVNRYVLFHGDSYDPLDTTNFNIDLYPSLTFSNINVPLSVIFYEGSGEIYQFDSNSNKVTLQDTTNGDTKEIIFNRHGAITNIN